MSLFNGLTSHGMNTDPTFSSRVNKEDNKARFQEKRSDFQSNVTGGAQDAKNSVKVTEAEKVTAIESAGKSGVSMKTAGTDDMPAQFLRRGSLLNKML